MIDNSKEDILILRGRFIEIRSEMIRLQDETMDLYNEKVMNIGAYLEFMKLNRKNMIEIEESLTEIDRIIGDI